MNYIREMNAFREWLLVNELPTSAVVLWYTLMSINNVARWKQMFNAPNRVVQQLTGLSLQGIHNAREILMTHDLIQCQKGKKGQAPIYKMNSLIQKNDQISERTLEPSTDQQLNILKHKQKKKKTETIHSELSLVSENKNKSTQSYYQQHSKRLFHELRKEAGI